MRVLISLLCVWAAVTALAKSESVSTATLVRNDNEQSVRVGDSKGGIQLLRQLEKVYGPAKTIKGRFVQTTVDKTFGEKIESKGSFAINKPNKLRVDYDPPYSSVLLVTEGFSYRYIPELKQVERYRINAENPIVQTNYMMLGFGARTEDVLQAYEVKRIEKSTRGGETAGIRLTPRNPDVAAFKTIDIYVDEKEGIPLEFVVLQMDGNEIVARIVRESLQVDQPLDERLFKPVFPKDAQIVDIR